MDEAVALREFYLIEGRSNVLLEAAYFIAFHRHDAEEARQFNSVGLEGVIDQSEPRGLDLASTILLEFGTEPGAVEDWRRRQQQRASATPGEALVAA